MNQLDLSWIRRRLAEHDPAAIDAAQVSRRAAVAIIFRPLPLEMLFIKRTQSEQDPWSGHMAFPGGQREERDPDPRETARRETEEEVGIDLRRAAELIGQVDDVHASAGGRVIPLAITPFVYQLTGDATATSSDEVAEVHWVPVTTLLDPAHADTVPWELAGNRYELPGIRVNDRVIWGLTYQMLMLLFGILEWKAGA